MTRLKCVNLGLPKTGTTTLARALTEAGWLVADHKVRRLHTQDPALAGTFVGRQVYRGYFETGDPFAFLGFYDALGEVSVVNATGCFWPQCDYHVLKAMRLARSSVAYVATWRRAEEVADSMLRWNNLGARRLPQGAIPGLPYGFGTTEAELIRWIEAHYEMLRDVFGDDPRYLELPVAAPDAPAQLAAHLKIDLPWWGRENENTDNPARGAA